jgi:hypothetical protein
VLLAHARYGEQWLEQVNAIASKQGKESDKQADAEDEQEQSFVQFGHRLLKKRAKKFLACPIRYSSMRTLKRYIKCVLLPADYGLPLMPMKRVVILNHLRKPIVVSRN